eukprot:TRINITY_DN4636_c0_g1_i2.p1 TRINITY_DN4636_c0_g1~~TRINITY_DN4636_c0_g1_i2.p1  ORF type:complete len:175 (+),score=24.31 TRINITY_DN4636_c0_g1_i2:626-1150(+)
MFSKKFSCSIEGSCGDYFQSSGYSNIQSCVQDIATVEDQVSGFNRKYEWDNSDCSGDPTRVYSVKQGELFQGLEVDCGKNPISYVHSIYEESFKGNAYSNQCVSQCVVNPLTNQEETVSYLFVCSDKQRGIPTRYSSIACSNPTSGTGTTTTASSSLSLVSSLPILFLAFVLNH